MRKAYINNHYANNRFRQKSSTDTKTRRESLKKSKVFIHAKTYLHNVVIKYKAKILFLSEKITIYHLCQVILSSITSNRTNLYHGLTDMIAVSTRTQHLI